MTIMILASSSSLSNNDNADLIANATNPQQRQKIRRKQCSALLLLSVTALSVTLLLLITFLNHVNEDSIITLMSSSSRWLFRNAHNHGRQLLRTQQRVLSSERRRRQLSVLSSVFGGGSGSSDKNDNNIITINDPKTVEQKNNNPSSPIVNMVPIPPKNEQSSYYLRQYYNSLKLDELESIYKPYTMVQSRHLEYGINSIHYINQKNIIGDIIECGVYKGGMTMAMIFANQRHNIERNFWLFDTFDGLPEPTSKNDDESAKKMYFNIKNNNMTNDNHYAFEGKWSYGSLQEVQNNILSTGYPSSNIHYVKGKVEDTIPNMVGDGDGNGDILPKNIAILRLDTDWYESTKIELEYLFDRLVPGGILIIDDYCTWKGSKEAVKEYFIKTRKELKINPDTILKQNKKQNKPCLVYTKPMTMTTTTTSSVTTQQLSSSSSEAAATVITTTNNNNQKEEEINI